MTTQQPITDKQPITDEQKAYFNNWLQLPETQRLVAIIKKERERLLKLAEIYANNKPDEYYPYLRFLNNTRELLIIVELITNMEKNLNYDLSNT